MKIADWPSMRLVIPLIGGILISDIIENTGTLTELLCCMLVPVLAMTFTSFYTATSWPDFTVQACRFLFSL